MRRADGIQQELPSPGAVVLSRVLRGEWRRCGGNLYEVNVSVNVCEGPCRHGRADVGWAKFASVVRPGYGVAPGAVGKRYLLLQSAAAAAPCTSTPPHLDQLLYHYVLA